METNGTGSSGRFLRIEEKLDKLIDVMGGFQVDVVQRLTRLEVTAQEARLKLEDAASAARDELGVSRSEARGKLEIAAGDARAVVEDRVADRSLNWMKVGIIASIVLGLTALALRLFGVG